MHPYHQTLNTKHQETPQHPTCYIIHIDIHYDPTRLPIPHTSYLIPLSSVSEGASSKQGATITITFPAQMSSSESGIPGESISDSQADVHFLLDGVSDSTSASASNAVSDRSFAVTQSSPLHRHLLQNPQSTPSVSLTTASPNTIQTSHFVGFRHPIPIATTMVHEPMLFCGPNFSKDTQSWSTYHPLPCDGIFDIDDKNLRAIVDSKEDSIIEAVSSSPPGCIAVLTKAHRLSGKLPVLVKLLAGSTSNGYCDPASGLMST